MDADRCFPAGILGHHYYVQNKLGTYRSVITAATYKLSKASSNVNLRNIFAKALQSVLETHSPLSFGLIQVNPQSSPSFIRLKEIQISDILRFHNVEISEEVLGKCDEDSEGLEERLDRGLEEKIGREHEEIWLDCHVKPIWRCVVFNYPEPSSSGTLKTSGSRLDVIFVYNHALADGLSGLTFHQALQKVLTKALSQPDPNSIDTYIVPEDISPPRPVESLIKLNVNTPLPTTISNQEKTINTDFWTFENPTLPTPKTYKSRVRFLTIPRENLNFILQTCRKNKITLTGLLHGLLITSLTRNLEMAPAFRAITPFSLRSFISPPPPEPEICCHVSLVGTDFSASLIQQIRNTSPRSIEEKEVIYEIGRRFRDQIHDELGTVREGGGKWLEDMARVIGREGEGYGGYCLGKLGRRREETYELSNVHEFMPLEEGGEGKLELEKMMFTQCGMVTGAAIGCSVVSTRGGPLVAGFTWMDGVVEIQLLERIIGEVKGLLMAL